MLLMSDEIHRPPSQLGDLRATREAELCGVFLHVMVSDGCPCRQRVPDTTKITIVNDPVAGDRHAGMLVNSRRSKSYKFPAVFRVAPTARKRAAGTWTCLREASSVLPRFGGARRRRNMCSEW